MEHPAESIRVEETPIGRGVFATRVFKREEIIGEITGHLLDDPDYQSSYCIALEDDWSLEPDAPFRFLNHSCHPNCTLTYTMETPPTGGNPRPRVWLETIRPVQSGEQCTIDYAWPAEVAIPCQCGHPHCRGWIVAQEELSLVRAQNRDAHVAVGQ